jgi:hypothetical protein
MHTDIHASSEIQSHDSSVRVGEDFSCLRSRGHGDRPLLLFMLIKLYIFNMFLSYCSCVLYRTIESKVSTHKWSLGLCFISRLVAGENRFFLRGKAIPIHCYFVTRQPFNSSTTRYALSWLYLHEQWSTMTEIMIRLSL